MSEHISRPKRKAKPSNDMLVDGKMRFIRLDDAVAAASDDDTIAIIPPDDSDEEDVDEEAASATQCVQDVAGLLDIIRPADDDICSLPKNWSRHKTPKEFLSGPRIPTLSESHPLLATLSPVQLFRLYFSSELTEMIALESERYARQCGNMTYCE